MTYSCFAFKENRGSRLSDPISRDTAAQPLAAAKNCAQLTTRRQESRRRQQLLRQNPKTPPPPTSSDNSPVPSAPCQSQRTACTPDHGRLSVASPGSQTLPGSRSITAPGQRLPWIKALSVSGPPSAPQAGVTLAALARPQSRSWREFDDARSGRGWDCEFGSCMC